MIAYCGLNCSKCEAYIATKSGDMDKIAQVAEKWSKEFKANIRSEHVICDGCKVDERKSYHCQNLCEVRKCCIKNNKDHCGECAHFSCEELEFTLAHSPEALKNLQDRKN